MSAPVPSPTVGFRRLERALARRRFRALDLRLRAEVALIAILLAGFVFWQIRVPLDGLQRARGTLAAGAVLLGYLALLALIGGALAGTRHRRRLASPEGPPWLALPLPPHLLHRHLVWASRGSALLTAVPALGGLAAGAGLLPAWWLLLLAALYVWMVIEGARLGCAVAYRIAVRHAFQAPGLHPLVRVLSTVDARGSVARLPAAPWRRRPAWRALWWKDLALSRRPTPARPRAGAPLVFGALSALAWTLPASPPLGRVLAFGLALLAAAAIAEWLIAVAATDPFAVLRGLPIGVATVWGARAGWALLATTGLVAVHAFAASSLPALAHRVFLVWIGAATLAITVLGANYAVTLYPRAELARRMLTLTLGLAVAASLMIPLLGWLLLLTAVLHSARRLPRWQRLEEA